MQDSRIIKAAGPISAVVGMLALRACLYHAKPPSDAAVTAVVRDVVIRERLAKEREGGTLEAQAALASQLPALREAKVKVVSVHRPWLSALSRHGSRFYVRARVSWEGERVEGCFPVETSAVAPAICYSSVAMDLCE